MEKLEPAGLFGRVVSTLVPKRLEVEVRTAALADGNVEFVPIFTVGGKAVPGELVSASARQEILGHVVTAGPEVAAVQSEIGGQRRRYSKRNAAEVISQMSQRGVRLRSGDRAYPPLVEKVKPEVSLHLHPDDSLSVRSQLTTAKGLVVEKPTDLEELKRDGGWFISHGSLYQVEAKDGPLAPTLYTRNEGRQFHGHDVPTVLKEVERQRGDFHAVEKNPPLEPLGIFGDLRENRAQVEGDRDSVRVTPSLAYAGKDGKKYEPPEEAIEEAVRRGGGFTRIPEGWIEITPEAVAEHRRAVADLRQELGPLGDIRGGQIPEALSKLVRPEGLATPWVAYFSNEVKNSHRLVETPADARFRLNVVESDGNALLELDPRYDHERFRLPHAEVADAVGRGEDWVRRDRAWVKLDRRRFDDVRRAAAGLGIDAGPDGYRFSAARREEVVEVFSRIGSVEHTEAYAAFLRKLADFTKIEEAALPSSVRPGIRLRPYQQHGYNWLVFLRRFGLNGILADDMGLGKTLQTLAAIRREQERQQVVLPSLVICPTSVVANWKAEATKFFAGFEVRAYVGAGRERLLEEIAPRLRGGGIGDGRQALRPGNFLVITSFDIARRDADELSRIPWLYVVVDEAHHIKNPAAQRTRAIKTINGQHKLALTGTPIQNNLEELWSLFDYVMPGYLGARTRFKETYGHGAKVNWDAVRNGDTGLRTRIHPFILRRLKEDVAKDLPEKIVVSQPVELTPLQVRLYKDTLESVEFRKLVEAVESKGVERSGTEILAVYTRLRNICNHPVLASSGDIAAARLEDSGKLDALEELMEEIGDGGHRALLFCQSTRMLDIIERFFAKWGVSFLRLDGSTPPAVRQGFVDQFNGDRSIRCFLISTKAGGTGLNLTGADTVIFYDHDWNPANDRQAQDRAYRIGQTRNVTIYKLVSVGTIEERIIERQELKQELADEIVGADREGFKRVTKEQLLSLFSYRE